MMLVLLIILLFGALAALLAWLLLRPKSGPAED